jgi:hypothetical protein
MTGKQYPGAGKWDPQSGRSKAEIAQGQQNLDALKGVGNKIANFFGGKKAEAPTNGAAAALASSSQPRPAESVELAAIKKLSGL